MPTGGKNSLSIRLELAPLYIRNPSLHYSRRENPMLSLSPFPISTFYFLFSIFQLRPHLSRRKPRQRRESPAEFARTQSPLAAQPAQKIVRPPLFFLQIAFRTRRHQVAV